MKPLTLTALALCLFVCSSFGQTKKDLAEAFDKDKLLAGSSENACKCIDTLDVYNKSRDEVSQAMHRCIDVEAAVYSSSLQLMEAIKKQVTGKDTAISISLDIDQESEQYKKNYYALERKVMNDCASLKQKIAANDAQNRNSMTRDEEAMDWYNKGIAAVEQENYTVARDYFRKAVKKDSMFAFAWDNLGLCCRRLNLYDDALEAYRKSLQIDPKGLTPLQNMPIVYQYKKDYPSAVRMYKRFIDIAPEDPEGHYGLGRTYIIMEDMENGLKSLCKAYNLYIALHSPYRTDAENMISAVYGVMKEKGQEARFKDILKEYHINME